MATVTQPVLVVSTSDRACGIPIAAVVETLRPLPTVPDDAAPSFVLGHATVRGQAVPVVDLARVLASSPAPTRRWVHLRAGDHAVALAVAEVAGVSHGAATGASILADVSPATLGALGHFDAALRVLLSAATDLTADVAAAPPTP